MRKVENEDGSMGMGRNQLIVVEVVESVSPGDSLPPMNACTANAGIQSPVDDRNRSALGESKPEFQSNLNTRFPCLVLSLTTNSS